MRTADRDMTPLQSLLIARLHENSVLFVEQVFSYLSRDESRSVPVELREQLLQHTLGVTATLSRSAFSFLAIKSFSNIHKNVEELLERLDSLALESDRLGVGKNCRGYRIYRQKLADAGFLSEVGCLDS